MKITIGQFNPTGDPTHSYQTITRFAAASAADGGELLLLPEEAMATAGLVSDDLNRFAQEHWPQFVQHLRDTARSYGVAIVAGGYEPNEPLPYNSLIAIDASGDLLATYRKLHLYDAFAYQESSKIMRGDGGPTVVRIGTFTIGLVNCYDLRFPELTRTLVEMGADILAVSAAWVAGPLKEEHWSTLLRARALENTCWAVAAGVASAECIGRSMAVDPLGVIRGSLGEEREATLTVEVTKERLDDARTTLPVLRNRRLIHRMELR